MPLPIVVIFWQSNAAGRATLPGVPSALGYATPYAGVQHMYRVEDVPVGLDAFTWDFDVGPENLDYIDSGNGTFGIELSLGRKLHRAGYEHAIGKMAMGSTSVGVHWKAVGGTYPSTGDKLFTQFVDYCHDMETALGGTIAHAIGIGGETDGNNAGHAAAFATNTAELITAFRAEFPSVPFYFNRLHIDCGSTHVATIRAQQTILAATVPGVVLFNVDDLALDGAHYTSPAFVTLGERFANAILGGRPSVGLCVGGRS